jgi:leucyl aminopeptidase
MALKFDISKDSLWNLKSDAVVVFLKEGQELPNQVKVLVKDIEHIVKDRDFSGKAKSLVYLHSLDSNNFKYLILAGLGKMKDGKLNIESYRRTLGSMLNSLSSYAIKSVSLQLPLADDFKSDVKYLAQQTATILLMSDYHFNTYITDKDRIKKQDITITISAEKDFDVVKSGVDEGIIIADAVNSARFWVDLPPSALTPIDLAANAQQIASDNNLKCTVFGEKEIGDMGMGGLAGVSAGSDQDCRLAILEYKTDKKDAPTVCIVGKGITFDSGGLSLKPSQYMENMKDDMSGASAVIATMKAVAKLKPDVNVIAIAPMAENLPSGKATKVGDIVRFYNGKTAEIKNTDAEGRLVLADALSYAVKHYKPDAIIDLATLTGACQHAIGPFFSGLFGEHEEIIEKVQRAGDRSGDYVWRLPLTDDYKVAVISEVADLCNIGKSNYYAGGTTAACFLQNFVEDVPWAHLDIAGTAFDVPDRPYYKKSSATGVGVRLLVDLLRNWN